MVPLPNSSARTRALAAALVAALSFAWPLPGADASTDHAGRPGPAYWLAGADGGVFAFGRARYAGGTAGSDLQQRVVGIARTPDGEGYWLAARDGGVFAFGSAPYLGGTAGLPLTHPVVGIAATPSGRGYWLAAADGGIFAFGDAAFHGGLAGAPLTAPVTAIAGTPSGQGYWLAARDGGVFAFGDAAFHGGLAAEPLNRPVAAMAATPSGRGYWLLASDGGVFAFGDAWYRGSPVFEHPRARAVGIASTRSGHGYWVAAADGGVFAFGDAGFYGSAADAGLRGSVVGIASGSGRAVPAPPAEHLRGVFGWDVSWPQCGRALPVRRHAYAVVGVNDGQMFSTNPCLAEQHRWSLRDGSVGALYINTNFPRAHEEAAVAATTSHVCAAGERACHLFHYGVRGAEDAMAVARAAGAAAPLWWLDVETMNHWSRDPTLNAQVILGMVHALERAGLEVGIYSTSYQWRVIAGDLRLGLPLWVAGPRNIDEAPAHCGPAKAFAGGVALLVQFPHEGLDGNILCPAGVARGIASFRTPAALPVPFFGPPPDLDRMH